jgi:hypothetical protein
MPKNLETLSGPKLETLIETLSARHSAVLDDVIAAGWGDKNGREIREIAKADPSNTLAAAYVRSCDAYLGAAAEMDRRKRWHGGTKPIRRAV